MRVLVVGANGLLGSNVVHAGQQRGWGVSGTYHSTRPNFDIPLTQFDLQEYSTFDKIIDEHGPDVVVNCAAMTDVDGCEQNPEAAHVVNSEAPAGMASRCEQAGIDFVHVSTDYVFDGTARDPYSETAVPNPVQVYGESKLAGEQAVRDAMETPLLPRLSFVWGIHRSTGTLSGFPAWVREQLQADEAIPLFTDQWVTPTRAGQAAETVLELVEQEASGLYHVACTSCVTPYEFGEILADRIDTSPDLLQEGSTTDIDREATRPTYSCLDVTKVANELERAQPTLRENVDEVWGALS
jgi:dTDP-4-dehydrorhamnose reductase